MHNLPCPIAYDRHHHHHLQHHSGRVKCDYTEAWRFQVMWQVVELMDFDVVNGAFKVGFVGCQVLQGKARCRRLSGILHKQAGVSLDRKERHAIIVAEGGDRPDVVRRSEKMRMANYVYASADVVGESNSFALCVDASSVSQSDLLVLALYDTVKDFSMWLPPQDSIVGNS
jgi:hypothetical protein